MYTILGFTQSHSGELDDIERFVQLIPGSYKSDKPINVTGINKLHLKADCIQGSSLKGVRQPILYSFALDQRPGQKIYEEAWMKLFKKINISVLSQITLYLESDNRKRVGVNNETTLITCPLNKKNEFIYDTT